VSTASLRGEVTRPARWLGAAVLGYGAATLLAWLVAPSVLTLVAMTRTPTKPATAVALVLLGGVLLRPRAPALARGAALSAAAVIAADGLLAALLDRPLLFGSVLFPDAWARHTPDGDGRLALSSAVALFALTAGLAVVRRRRGLATTAGLLAFAVGYVAVLGHLYGVSHLYQVQSAVVMALPTALAVIACAGALVFYGERMPLNRLVHDRGTPGALVRRLLPLAFLVPPVIGWLQVQAREARLIDPGFGVALMVLALVTATVATVLVGARTAADVDGARERALEQVEALNAVLGERVAAAVAEVEESRERLRALLDRTPVGIFETAPDGTRRYTNRRWRELVGATEEDAGGTDWTSVLHPDDRAEVAARWAECLAAGREFTARYRYRRPDGDVVWVDATSVAMRDADGQVTRWLGSVTDVTDQVRAQEELAASEQRYRSVVATMAEGVVLQDHDGQILAANEAACRLLGLSHAELAGRSSIDPGWRCVREDGSDFPGEQHPPMAALRTRRPVRDVLMGVHRPDGSLVWIKVNSQPLFDEHSEEEPVVTGVVTTFVDVTATRAATAALRRSEQQFRAAMEHAPNGMALVELDGRFREVNPALCALVGYPEQELVGQTFQRITHPDDLDADLANVDRLLHGADDSYTMEKRYLAKSGAVVWVLLAVSCVRDDDGRPAYFIAQMQDITASHAAKEELAHRALHDPLTGLANRDMLMDHLAHALARGARAEGQATVMFLDLDDFKTVNDSYGHEAGDRLLVTVAERLRAVVRPGDIVARLGGDEFVVVAEQLPHSAAVRALAERVRAAVAQPVSLGDAIVLPGGSLGVAVADPDDDARSVLRRADAAMYRAKAYGRGRVEMAEAADPVLAPSAEPG